MKTFFYHLSPCNSDAVLCTVVFGRVARFFEEARVAFDVKEWGAALSKLHAIQKEVPISKNQKVRHKRADISQNRGNFYSSHA